MGVEGSSKLLGEGIVFEPKGKNKNGNDIIAIDGPQLVFQLAKGHCSTNEVIRNTEGDTMTACLKIVQFILNWLNKYVIESYNAGNGCTIPVIVFDGHAPSSKYHTIKKRKDKQGNALKKLDVLIEKIKSDQRSDYTHTTEDTSVIEDDECIDIMDEYTDLLDHNDTCVRYNRERVKTVLNNTIDNGTKEQYTKHLRNSYNPSNEFAYIRLMLKWMGIPYIESPHEGDAQCAALGIKFGAGTITGDIDILLMGGSSIYKFKNIRNLVLEEYRLETVIESIKERIRRLIKICKMDPDYDRSLDHCFDSNQNVSFDLVDLRSICCLLGTDYCPGLKIDRSKIELDAVLILYIQNDRSILKVMHRVRDHRFAVIKQMVRLGIMKDDRYYKDISKYPKISEQYIQRMLNAFEQYNMEKVYDPSPNLVNITEPDVLQLMGFCSSFMSKDSIIRLVRIVREAYDTFTKYKNEENVENVENEDIPDTTLFASFESYHRRCNRIHHNNEVSTKSGQLGMPSMGFVNCSRTINTDIQPRYVGYEDRYIQCVC